MPPNDATINLRTIRGLSLSLSADHFLEDDSLICEVQASRITRHVIFFRNETLETKTSKPSSRGSILWVKTSDIVIILGGSGGWWEKYRQHPFYSCQTGWNGFPLPSQLAYLKCLVYLSVALEFGFLGRCIHRHRAEELGCHWRLALSYLWLDISSWFLYPPISLLWKHHIHQKIARAFQFL
jgi:hypothetical protein